MNCLTAFRLLALATREAQHPQTVYDFVTSTYIFFLLTPSFLPPPFPSKLHFSYLV